MIVEDDKLVRKNLINKLNWDNYGMSVVAEAKNGEKALEELNKVDVDLMITDLAMPIMSGIDLIREVRKLYPNIFVVVLTLHQDFEYIQEVMRLGAIDYIAKVELDDQTMGSTLLRIQHRIEKEISKYRSSSDEHMWIEDSIILLANKPIQTSNLLLSIISEQKVIKINDEIIVIKTNKQNQSLKIDNIISNQSIFDQLLIVRVNNQMENWNTWKQKLSEHKNSLLFYELNEENKIQVKDIDQLIFPALENDLYLKEIQTQLLSMEWIKDKEHLEELLLKVKNVRLNKLQINDLILVTINECSRVYSDFLSNTMQRNHIFHFWNDIEKQMRNIQHVISTSLYSQSVSVEANQCILEAISIIGKNLDAPLTANDVANQVNMSRSYFSICFKNITGHTFNEYIRIMRINKAKNYLSFTNLKIGTIAENVGYKDIRYFSNVFRQSTGLLPTEYRKRYMKY